VHVIQQTHITSSFLPCDTVTFTTTHQLASSIRPGLRNTIDTTHHTVQRSLTMGKVCYHTLLGR